MVTRRRLKKAEGRKRAGSDRTEHHNRMALFHPLPQGYPEMNKTSQIRPDSEQPPSPNDEQFIPFKVRPRRRFNFILDKELFANQAPTLWAVRDFIEAGAFACMIGPSEGGKTFVALDFGLCVSSGKNFHGRPVTQGPVLYVCGEGKKGILRRINAWRLENGIPESPFFVSEIAAQLLDKMSLAEVMAATADIMVDYGMPTLIIIDTLNRNFGDGDENSSSDMTRFVAAVDQLRDNFGCAVLVVHHTGLNDARRGRGSSVLRGATDFEYLVTRKGQPGDESCRITLETTKIKDFERPPTLAFKPVIVDLGQVDEEGRPITSLALRLAATTSGSKTKAGKMTKPMKIALDALKAVPDEFGQASDDAWRQETYAKGITKSDTPAARQKAFNRAKSDLLEAGLIGAEGDYFYVVPSDTGQTGQ